MNLEIIDDLQIPKTHNRIVFGMASGDDWKANTAMAAMLFMAHCMKVPFNGKPNGVRVCNERGSVLPRSRERIVEVAIKSDAEWLLFVDSDMVFPRDLFHRLAAHDKPVVAANCATRSVPAQPTARRASKEHPLMGERVFTDKESTGLERVWRVGTGIMLIQTRIFKFVSQPRFEMRWSNEAKAYVGEDWYFCEKLEKAGIPIFIDHDLSKEIQHIGTLAHDHDLVGEVIEQKELEDGCNPATAQA